MADMRTSLITMLHQLRNEMDVVQSQGAGYYTCTPFARRFNKLVGQAAKLLENEPGLIETFESLDESDPKDPGDKLKVLLGIRIEIGQLIALLESLEPKKEEKDG
jgi:hypothetical protein